MLLNFVFFFANMATDDVEPNIATCIKDLLRRTKDGLYHRADLKRLGTNAWIEWIRDDFQDPDRGIADEQHIVPPYSDLVEAIRRLQPSTRGSAYDAVLTSLDTAVDERRADIETVYWTDPRLDHLLQVAQEAGHTSFWYPIQNLLCIFEPHPERLPYNFNELPSRWEYDIHGSALNALAEIAPPKIHGLGLDFWREELAKGPGAYAAICFKGAYALNNSVDEAFTLLPNIDWSDKRTQQQMFLQLYCLFKDLRIVLGETTIKTIVDIYKQKLPEQGVRVIDTAYQTVEAQ